VVVIVDLHWCFRCENIRRHRKVYFSRVAFEFYLVILGSLNFIFRTCDCYCRNHGEYVVNNVAVFALFGFLLLVTCKLCENTFMYIRMLI